MFLNSRKISVVLRIRYFWKSKRKRFNCWFSLIDFRHWLKIRTYSNLRNCSCFLWTFEDSLDVFPNHRRFCTGKSRWASKRRFLLNRRFTTFALTSALGKVITYFLFWNFLRLEFDVFVVQFRGRVLFEFDRQENLTFAFLSNFTTIVYQVLTWVPSRAPNSIRNFALQVMDIRNRDDSFNTFASGLSFSYSADDSEISTCSDDKTDNVFSSRPPEGEGVNCKSGFGRRPSQNSWKVSRD